MPRPTPGLWRRSLPATMRCCSQRAPIGWCASPAPGAPRRGKATLLPAGTNLAETSRPARVCFDFARSLTFSLCGPNERLQGLREPLERRPQPGWAEPGGGLAGALRNHPRWGLFISFFWAFFLGFFPFFSNSPCPEQGVGRRRQACHMFRSRDSWRGVLRLVRGCSSPGSGESTMR